MPTYGYKCDKCEYRFEVFQAMSDEPIKKCPKCGKKVRRLIFGGAGVIFKGSGFYVTDKAAGASSKTREKSTASSGESGYSKEADFSKGDTGSDKSKSAASTAADTGAVKESSAAKSETQGKGQSEAKDKTKPK